MTVLENIQKRLPAKPLKDSLPVSQTSPAETGSLRRRLSFGIIPSDISTTWAIRRTKSMSSFGETTGSSLKRWWNSSWNWILSRKPTFARDLEMDEEESSMLGFHKKGTLHHVFYKIRFEVRKLLNSKAGRDQGFKYDSQSYAQNFDDGVGKNMYQS
ncbi:hypothetical protein MKW94_013726 [Papaver nudicaule]|uniref:Uncharacterized protein n=1 Tax=Papaver nudicaule TaxID=74823 RepID=A0AA42B5J9_PAPNU|nr:hypothetical protein [Papaver nudicaule]